MIDPNKAVLALWRAGHLTESEAANAVGSAHWSESEDHDPLRAVLIIEPPDRPRTMHLGRTVETAALTSGLMQRDRYDAPFRVVESADD